MPQPKRLSDDEVEALTKKPLRAITLEEFTALVDSHRSLSRALARREDDGPLTRYPRRHDVEVIQDREINLLRAERLMLQRAERQRALSQSFSGWPAS